MEGNPHSTVKKKDWNFDAVPTLYFLEAILDHKKMIVNTVMNIYSFCIPFFFD